MTKSFLIKEIMIKIIKIMCIIVSLIAIIVLFINILVTATTMSKILSADKIEEFEADCIIVLGAGIENNKPSLMLADRLDRAIELYLSGAAPKIIMSGDHGRAEHDEVNVMKDYAIKAGVPSEDIFMDHAGFSTYDSLYRARYIFGVKHPIIVKQKYHIYRALYIANALEFDARGVCAESINYSGQTMRDVREVAARTKDFIYCIIKPKPTYLGEYIAITGNGDVTNDKTIA